MYVFCGINSLKANKFFLFMKLILTKYEKSLIPNSIIFVLDAVFAHRYIVSLRFISVLRN